MATAIYPGSFDPVTFGHLDIIRRASKIFDRLIVAVLFNPSKRCTFTPQERMEMIGRVTGDLPNVEAATSEKLLVDFAEERQSFVIVKGLRAVSDFEHEFQMALTNKKMNGRIETLFLTTNYRYLYLSSSIVREIGSLGGDISDFVPAPILEDVTRKLRENTGRAEK